MMTRGQPPLVYSRIIPNAPSSGTIAASLYCTRKNEKGDSPVSRAHAHYHPAIDTVFLIGVDSRLILCMQCRDGVVQCTSTETRLYRLDSVYLWTWAINCGLLFNG